jgi:hypothetical protein
MKYKIRIDAAFTHEVEVEAQSEQEAKARASDALMDYLDIEIRKRGEFEDFFENRLKQKFEVIEPPT